MLKEQIQEKHNVKIKNLKEFLFDIVDDFVDFTIVNEKYLLFKPYIDFNSKPHVDTFLSDGQRMTFNVRMAHDKKFSELYRYYYYFNAYLDYWIREYKKFNKDYVTFITPRGNYSLSRIDTKGVYKIINKISEDDLKKKSLENLLIEQMYKTIMSVCLDSLELTKEATDLRVDLIGISAGDDSSMHDSTSYINSDYVKNTQVFICPNRELHKALFNRKYPTVGDDSFKDLMVNLYLSNKEPYSSAVLEDKLRLLKALNEDPTTIDKELKSFYNLLYNKSHSSDLPLSPEDFRKLSSLVIKDIKKLSKSKEKEITKKIKKEKVISKFNGNAQLDGIVQNLHNQINNQNQIANNAVDDVAIPALEDINIPAFQWHNFTEEDLDGPLIINDDDIGV